MMSHKHGRGEYDNEKRGADVDDKNDDNGQ